VKGMRCILGIVGGACILFLATVDVRAEVFVDIYAGNAKTEKGKADVTGNVGGFGASGDVEYDSSFTVGGRVGGWIGRYFGVGLDVFHFDSNQKNNSIEQSNLAFALDLMGRLPLLASEGMPHGRLQPYVTVGPAIFVSNLEVPGFTDGRSTSVGFKGGAGLKFLFTQHIGLFGEYRYTYFKPTHDAAIGPASGELTQRIGTHHFVGGLAIHF
jgi:opacity protein-like surface antigen